MFLKELASDTLVAGVTATQISVADPTVGLPPIYGASFGSRKRQTLFESCIARFVLGEVVMRPAQVYQCIASRCFRVRQDHRGARVRSQVS